MCHNLLPASQAKRVTQQLHSSSLCSHIHLCVVHSQPPRFSQLPFFSHPTRQLPCFRQPPLFSQLPLFFSQPPVFSQTPLLSQPQRFSQPPLFRAPSSTLLPPSTPPLLSHPTLPGHRPHCHLFPGLLHCCLLFQIKIMKNGSNQLL